MNAFKALNSGGDRDRCARPHRLGRGVGLRLDADEFADAGDACGVGDAQIVERLVLVDTFEGADSIARDRDLVTANQRAIAGMTDANVRVLASEDNLVHAERAQLLVQTRTVEGAIDA